MTSEPATQSGLFTNPLTGFVLGDPFVLRHRGRFYLYVPNDGPARHGHRRPADDRSVDPGRPAVDGPAGAFTLAGLRDRAADAPVRRPPVRRMDDDRGARAVAAPWAVFLRLQRGQLQRQLRHGR